MKNQYKNVNISFNLFKMLVQYFFLLDSRNQKLENEIKMELQEKLKRLVDRENYTTYKTAATEEERETARQKYLDSKGIPRDFRW